MSLCLQSILRVRYFYLCYKITEHLFKLENRTELVSIKSKSCSQTKIPAPSLKSKWLLLKPATQSKFRQNIQTVYDCNHRCVSQDIHTGFNIHEYKHGI